MSLRANIERLEAAMPQGRPRITVKAPFTLAPIGTILDSTPQDVIDAVQRARAAQPSWVALGIRERRSILLRFHDLLLDHREEALDLIQTESGKARRYALEEVLDTALVARHYAIHAEDYLRARTHRGAVPGLTTVREYHQPLGVVGVIAPWNFPLILGITDLLAALMAGNAVVLRPDVQSSFTALWAADLLYQAGLPRNVLTVVTGSGSVLGPVLIDHVDFIMFTGSTATGKIVARRAAERLIGFSLELGGKNPMIVLDDADIRHAVDGLVRGAFTGAGQVCVSIERAFIPNAMFDQFTKLLVERVAAMKISATLDYGVDMGSLSEPGQLARVEAHVNDARAKGATVLGGGRARPDIGPLFYEPTLLSGVTPSMTVYSEETFGPVVSLYPYSNIEDAIRAANDTSYGLNASVWSANKASALAVAPRLQCGSVNINDAYAPTWTATSAAIGGMKESGLGRRHGAEGILKYTQAQIVATQHGMPLAAPPALAEETFARLVTMFLRVMRRIPGMR